MSVVIFLPGRSRRWVVVFAVTLAMIAYADRVAISQAAPVITKELHLTTVQMGWVFSAFGLAYAAGEIPSGWMIDRLGPRVVLTRIVLWWSFFTAATGWGWNFGSLFTIRLMFGAGESGCFPALAKVFSRWIPANERGMAEGIKAAGSRWGAALTPIVVVSLYSRIGWRLTFLAFGAVGLAWAAAFFHWYRDDPAAHPSVDAAEAALLSQTNPGLGRNEAIPWRAFLRAPSAWALCIQWFCHFYGFYFYITWLPTYLQQARGVAVRESALLAGLPLLLGGFGSLFCGWVLPHAARWTGGVAQGRRWLSYIAYAGAAALLLLFTVIDDPLLAVLVLGISAFLAELSGPTTWITAVDLGGKSVGMLAAGMNLLGHLGGSVAPAVIGYTLQATGNNWSIAFYTSAAIYAAGGLCWMFLDPVTPLGDLP